MALHDGDKEIEQESNLERKYGLGLNKAGMHNDPNHDDWDPRINVGPLMLGKDEVLPDYPQWAGAKPSLQPNFGPTPPVTSYAVSFPTNIGEGHFIHVEDMNRVSINNDLCRMEANDDAWYADTKFPEIKQYVYSSTSTSYNVMYPNGVVLPIQQKRDIVQRLTEFAKQHKMTGTYPFFNTRPGTHASGVMIITYYKIININAHNLNGNFTAGLSEMFNYYNTGRQNAMFPSISVPFVINRKIAEQGDDRLLGSVKTQVGNILDRPNGYVNQYYVREIRFIPESILVANPNGVFIPSTGIVIGGMKLLHSTQHMYADGVNKSSIHSNSNGASGSVVIDLIDNHSDRARYMKVGDKILPILPRQDNIAQNGIHIKYHRVDGIIEDILNTDLEHAEHYGIFKTVEACRMSDPSVAMAMKERELKTKELEINSKYETAVRDLERVRQEHDNLQSKQELEIARFQVEKQKLETERMRLETELQKRENEIAKYKQDIEMMQIELSVAKQKHIMTMEELDAKRYLALLEFSTEYETMMLSMREKRLDFMWKVQSGIIKHNIETTGAQFKIQELEAKRDYETSKFMADTSMSSLSIAGRVLKMLSL